MGCGAFAFQPAYYFINLTDSAKKYHPLNYLWLKIRKQKISSIVPKKAECTNLIVPVCVSSSHIAYGSIRMEPVFMIIRQSAAVAACIAIDKKQAVQDVAYKSLKEKLVSRKQVLSLLPDK